MFIRWDTVSGLIETGVNFFRAWLLPSGIRSYVGTGGVVTGGAATCVYAPQPVVYAYAGSGGVVVGGSAQVAFVAAPITPPPPEPSVGGGMPIRLVFPLVRGRVYQYVGTGGITVGGSAATSLSKTVPVVMVESVLRISGAAMVRQTRACAAWSVPLVVGGSAQVSRAHGYVPAGEGVRVHGAAHTSVGLDLRMAEDDAIEVALLLGPDWIEHPALEAVAELCR